MLYAKVASLKLKVLYTAYSIHKRQFFSSCTEVRIFFLTEYRYKNSLFFMSTFVNSYLCSNTRLSLADKEALPEPLFCLGVGSLNREQETVQVLLAPASQPQRILRSSAVIDSHWRSLTVIGRSYSRSYEPFIPANQHQRVLQQII
jgi:hypothetical protein